MSNEKEAVYLSRGAVQEIAACDPEYIGRGFAEAILACRDALGAAEPGPEYGDSGPAPAPGYEDTEVTRAHMSAARWRKGDLLLRHPVRGLPCRYEQIQVAAAIPGFLGYVYELPSGERDLSWHPRETAYRYGPAYRDSGGDRCFQPDGWWLGGDPAAGPQPVGTEHVDLVPVAVRFRKDG